MDQTTFYKQLIDRYVSNTASSDELEVIDHLIAEGKLDDLLMPHMQESWRTEALAFEAEINSGTVTERKFKLWPRIASAAAVLLVLSAGLWFYTTNRTNSSSDAQIVNQNDIAPGRNTATLTLANGKIMKLSDAKTGVVIDASKLTYNDGSLLLDSAVSSLPLTLTASTPRGGTYQIILPDGTKVWLNAASTLKFPSTFAAVTQRKVILSGEAYFEVAKDKAHPFIVSTQNQEVEVLGTHFNINSYPDQENIKTTLLEGLIRIAAGNAPGRIILPNQQSVLSNSGSIKIIDVDATEFIDWKNGDFIFRKERLADIMSKVSRWYDVDVVYEKGVDTDQTFSGTVSRSRNISKVLEIMQTTKQVTFKIAGKKIIVAPSEGK